MKKNRNYTPLLMPLAGTIAGIYTQATYNFPFKLLIAGILILSAVTLGVYTHRRKTAILLSTGLLLAFVGALLVGLQRHEQSLYIQLFAHKKLNLIGTIASKDEWISQTKGEVLRISLMEVDNPEDPYHKHVSCDVLVYTKQTTNFCVGDTIIIKNVIIKPPQHATQSDNATYNDYLIKESIVSAVFVIGISQCAIISRPTWSIQRFLWNFRNALYQTLKRRLSTLSGEYFGLIFLGNKQQPTINQLRTTFSHWGISHYLARSGLHIVLFIVIWTALLRILPIHLHLKKILLVMICIAYALLSWTSIPFARAYYAFLLMQGGELFYQSINYLHILTLICLGILLFNPMQLFFLDFQLTFGLTFTLVFLSATASSHKNVIQSKK